MPLSPVKDREVDEEQEETFRLITEAACKSEGEKCELQKDTLTFADFKRKLIKDKLIPGGQDLTRLTNPKRGLVRI